MSDEPDKKPAIPLIRPTGKKPLAKVGGANGWVPPPAPELRAVLTRFATPEEREAVIAAYFNQARGDPQSYPVQMALVQRALFLALDAAPEQIGARLDATLEKLAALLAQQQAEQSAHAEAVRQCAGVVTGQVDAIKTVLREELLKHRAAIEQQVAELRQEVVRVQDTANYFSYRAETLHAYQGRVYWLAGVAIFLLGVVALPLTTAVVDGLRALLHF